MDITNYWIDKDERARKAMEHTKWVERMYKHDILYSSDNTLECSFDSSATIERLLMTIPPEIIIEDTDSVSAIFKYSKMFDGGLAVLNFASFKNPGGMFLKGSSAQEESLCMSSTLYNVLKRHENFYIENRKMLNRGLYLDRALYSPRIAFIKNPAIAYHCDVITCAAPNKGAAMRNGVSEQENTIALTDRIRFILNICNYKEIDTVILGAYGCGVFKQDPYEVAMIFKNEINFMDLIMVNRIIFAIPGGKNLEAFKEVFSS